MTTEWIDTDAALRDLCTHLAAQPFIAVDTEFHRERTFYAELALVQVASPERVALVDPLTSLDLTPLDEVMLHPGVLKVMHASAQDLEIFFDRTGKVPGPLFDTQVAATLVGLGEQIGYGALVAEVTGTQLKKVHGRTDWMRRPLDPATKAYAADDVIHLRDVYRELQRRIEEQGRTSWLEEEQRALTSEATYTLAEDDAWTKVKGTHRLGGAELAAVQRLAAWREGQARSQNRPRRRILSDEAIVDVARLQPDDERALERIRMLDPGVRRQHGAALVRCVVEALATPKEQWPHHARKGSPRSVDPAVVDALSAVLRLCARDAGTSPSVLASRDDLERLAAGERDVDVCRGFRAALAGDALVALLEGEARLQVDQGRLRLVR